LARERRGIQQTCEGKGLPIVLLGECARLAPVHPRKPAKYLRPQRGAAVISRYGTKVDENTIESKNTLPELPRFAGRPVLLRTERKEIARSAAIRRACGKDQRGHHCGRGMLLRCAAL